jgi:undecaprenyl phosphate-alpha-L-ara4N flippase subunit ArnE
MTSLSFLLLLVVVVLSVAGQLALKHALNSTSSASLSSQQAMIRMLSSPYLWGWFISYAVTTVLWLAALTKVPLSRAFPILGLQFALIPLAAGFLLHERVAFRQWVGILMIIAGVALVV